MRQISDLARQKRASAVPVPLGIVNVVNVPLLRNSWSTWEELRRSSVPLIPQRESQLLAGTSQKRTLAENCISRGVPEPTGLTGVVVLTV